MEKISGDMMDLLDAMHEDDGPAWTTPELAELAGRGDDRRDVMRDLEDLALLGEIETKNPTGRARLWWLEGTRKPPRGDERARALADGQEALEQFERARDGAGDGANVGADVGAALEGYDPGRSARERDHKREIGEAVLGWLAERDSPMQRSDVLEERDRRDLDLELADTTFWQEYARPALKHAAGTGYVEKPDSARYVWTGADH